MISIPEKLKEFSFVKVRTKDKKAAENWGKEENHYNYNSLKLKKHLDSDGNYGILTGNGMIVIDIDNTKILDEVNLPETFTVKTSKGVHYYYYSDLNSKIILLNSSKEHFGEIQSKGQYIIGPNSIHPNGSKYEIMTDIPLSYLSKKKIKELFINYIPTTKTNTIPTTIILSERNSEDLELIDIFTDDRFDKKEDYTIKEGISFVKIYNLKIFKEGSYFNKGNLRPNYQTLGDVNRSPNMYIGLNIPLIFTVNGIKELRQLHFESLENNNFIIYRASERLWAIELVEDEIYNELISKEDFEIINYFQSFKELSFSKLNNLKRNKNWNKILDKLLNGIEVKSLTDEIMGRVLEEAVKKGYTDDQLHKIYATYYQSRYNFEETRAQIDYTKRKLEV